MDKHQLKDDDVLGLAKVKLAICKSGKPAIISDESGNEYVADCFGNFSSNNIHPAQTSQNLLLKLAVELNELQNEQKRAAEHEKMKSNSPWRIAS